jgi:hypothetical protein
VGIKRTIWRHEIPDIVEPVIVPLPRAAVVIHFDIKADGTLHLWEIHKPEDEQVLVTRRFQLLATGQPAEVWPDHYIGTAMKPGADYVLHLFEV